LLDLAIGERLASERKDGRKPQSPGPAAIYDRHKHVIVGDIEYYAFKFAKPQYT
jgi:hypothetical protein